LSWTTLGAGLTAHRLPGQRGRLRTALRACSALHADTRRSRRPLGARLLHPRNRRLSRTGLRTGLAPHGLSAQGCCLRSALRARTLHRLSRHGGLAGRAAGTRLYT